MGNEILKPQPFQAVLFDLDNTLYDRDLAFEKWTRGFVEEQFAEESVVFDVDRFFEQMAVPIKTNLLSVCCESGRLAIECDRQVL